MTVWNHTRKGRIEGRVLSETEDFITIELTCDQRLRMLSTDDDGHRRKGDRVTARRAFLREVSDDSVLS